MNVYNIELRTMNINQEWIISALMPHNETIPTPSITELNEVLLRHPLAVPGEDLASASADTMRKEIVALNKEIETHQKRSELQADKIRSLGSQLDSEKERVKKCIEIETLSYQSRAFLKKMY